MPQELRGRIEFPVGPATYRIIPLLVSDEPPEYTLNIERKEFADSVFEPVGEIAIAGALLHACVQNQVPLEAMRDLLKGMIETDAVAL